jgi:biopolymer transport protein TolQ
MGLVAAIPAGIAYNRYINNIDNIAREYENFIDEFVGLLQRKLYSSRDVTQDQDVK